MSDRRDRRDRIVLDDLVDGAKVALDTAASDGLLAVVGADTRVLDELIRTIAWRTVEQLDAADLAAILGQSPQVLAARAAPGGNWKDWRKAEPDAPTVVADVVRATIEGGVRGALRAHLRERVNLFVPAASERAS